MAVGFQRRNTGLLAQVDSGGGTEAFRDFVQNPIALAMADTGGELPAGAPSAGPVDGEVLPPEQATPRDGLARAEAATQQLLAMAEKQRASASNPLNRGLSILGGVLGAPINFLDGVFSGDMSRVTAPFTPQQNADQRFFQTSMALENNLAEIRQNYAQAGASQANALRLGMQANRETEQAAYDELGRISSTMLFMDEGARRQQLPALVAIARRYGRDYPGIADQVQELINNGYDNASLVAIGGMSKDEGARARVNEYLYGNKQTSLGDGLGVTTYSRPGMAPSVYGPGATMSGMPAISGRAPTTATVPAVPQTGIDFSNMSDEQLDAFIQAQGGNQ